MTDELHDRFVAWFCSKYPTTNPASLNACLMKIGYNAGYASRDAEVAALKLEIEKLKIKAER